MKIQTKVKENCLLQQHTSNEANTVHRGSCPNVGRPGPLSNIWIGPESWLPCCQSEGKDLLFRWNIYKNSPRVASDGAVSQMAV